MRIVEAQRGPSHPKTKQRFRSLSLTFPPAVPQQNGPLLVARPEKSHRSAKELCAPNPSYVKRVSVLHSRKPQRRQRRSTLHGGITVDYATTARARKPNCNRNSLRTQTCKMSECHNVDIATWHHHTTGGIKCTPCWIPATGFKPRLSVFVQLATSKLRDPAPLKRRTCKNHSSRHCPAHFFKATWLLWFVLLGTRN